MEDAITENGGFALHCTVGEYTVVRKVKENDAVMGGDFYGCIVIPGEFCINDSMVVMVKMLEIVAKEGYLSSLISSFPDYFLSKGSFECPEEKMDKVIQSFKKMYDGSEMDLVDGVKVILDDGWLLVRPSNVKGVVKVYAQANDRESADKLVSDTIDKLKL